MMRLLKSFCMFGILYNIFLVQILLSGNEPNINRTNSSSVLKTQPASQVAKNILSPPKTSSQIVTKPQPSTQMAVSNPLPSQVVAAVPSPALKLCLHKFSQDDMEIPIGNPNVIHIVLQQPSTTPVVNVNNEINQTQQATANAEMEVNNANISENINENLNEIENANANQNTNANQNENENENDNANQNDNDNKNDNVNVNETTIVDSFKKYITLDKVSGFFKKNALLLAASGGACIYGAIFLRLRCLSSFLSKNDHWSNWKKHMSFEKMVSMDWKKIGGSLARAICIKYASQNTEKNLIFSLVCFINDVDLEIKSLKIYLWWSKVLQKIKLKSFFFLNKNLVSEAQDRIDRLAFLKNLIEMMFSDLAEINLNNKTSNS